MLGVFPPLLDFGWEEDPLDGGLFSFTFESADINSFNAFRSLAAWDRLVIAFTHCSIVEVAEEIRREMLRMFSVPSEIETSALFFPEDEGRRERRGLLFWEVYSFGGLMVPPSSLCIVGRSQYIHPVVHQ
ncbi:hypothetical protein CHM34_03680 [Paludifilum halophilum]|uniref:Uncharacterized protein n=1 Tax=Paludifilum halophilum TaxID=1642702 RepID=A0A235B9D1_9BACL|nr:hypothetical protein CHM34_03680 [Paludifilum halophilum]